MKPTLTLTFEADYGQRYCMRIDLDEHTAREMSTIEPPMLHGLPGIETMVPLQSFDEVVTILKRREFRKDLFMAECQRLGALLAERMEDAEGWHDTSRVEPAKRELVG